MSLRIHHSHLTPALISFRRTNPETNYFNLGPPIALSFSPFFLLSCCDHISFIWYPMLHSSALLFCSSFLLYIHVHYVLFIFDIIPFHCLFIFVYCYSCWIIPLAQPNTDNLKLKNNLLGILRSFLWHSSIYRDDYRLTRCKEMLNVYFYLNMYHTLIYVILFRKSIYLLHTQNTPQVNSWFWV